MASRLPTASDFPQHLILSITPSPASSPRPTNILLILPGLGDTASALLPLAQRLQLPETVILTLQGPLPVPFDLGGFHWGDDISFTQTTSGGSDGVGGMGGLDYDAGFTKATHTIVQEVVRDTLIAKCGFRLRNIHFLGLGQGGMAALAAAATLKGDESNFGGVISLGGVVPCTTKERGVGTPILICGGERETCVTKTGLLRTKETFKNVEYVKWKRAGDGMARSKDEMISLMRFWAPKMGSRAGVPEGAREVT